jgi:hypothetical protein
VPRAARVAIIGPAAGFVRAAALNPSETQITLPDQINWAAWTAGPPHSAEIATMFGGFDKSRVNMPF